MQYNIFCGFKFKGEPKTEIIKCKQTNTPHHHIYIPTTTSSVFNFSKRILRASRTYFVKGNWLSVWGVFAIRISQTPQHDYVRTICTYECNQQWSIFVYITVCRFKLYLRQVSSDNIIWFSIACCDARGGYINFKFNANV